MKTVPFSGIVLETSNPQDGQLTHMVNLRHTTTGSVEPVGDNPKVYTMHDGRELLYIHKGNGYENWISYDGSTLYYEAYRYGDDTTVRPMYYNDGESTETKIGVPIYQIDGFNDITSVGNTLVVLTDGGIFYFLCYLYGESGTYVYKNISINEDDIKVLIKKTDAGSEGIGIPFSFEDKEVSDVITEILCKGFDTNPSIYEKMAELKSRGLLQNVSLLRWALRMYDGSYTLQSAPILILNRNAIHVNGYAEVVVATAYFEYYKLKVSIAIPEYLKNSDVYTGIDIFMNEIQYYDTTDTYNKNINAFKLDENNHFFDDDPFYTDDKKLIERILSNANFYRIAQYDFNDNIFPLSENIDLSDMLENLQLQPKLTDDSYSHNQTFSNKIFNYNNKIHIANIKQRLYKGYPLEMFITYAGNERTIVKYISTTYINTTLGEAKVVREQNYLNNNQFILLSPLLSYPDSRAYKMTISIVYEERGESGHLEYYLFNKTFKLKPHDFLNLAYYFPDDVIEPIDITGSIIALSELPITPNEQNNIETSPNKIKVSATDNPFIFPVEQTYTIGNGKIIGMAAATPALSQGQYGQFPLYVFTDEGIYMMQTGSGEVVYTNVFPVSRDVCDNPDSILSLDNAVLFSSNNKIFILSGYSAKPISDPLEAEYIPNPGNLSNPYGNIISPYTKYAYNYQFAEIIVTPEESNISLIYDLNHKIWRERILIPNDYTIAQFVHSYPVAYAIDDYNFNVYDLSIEEKNNDKFKNIAIQTAPIVLGNTGFKKIERSVLRAIASGNITITIYASNDNISFYKMVATTVNTHNLVHDIPIPRIPSSWRYYYLCIEGDMGFKSTITRWDIQEKITFNTKLR